jgi:D-amino-acid dehydrogenase
MVQTIAVIGGGITGVTTAYALMLRGFSVTLFERHRYAAMETSFANAGQISACNAEVWNRTATVISGLKWMLRKDAPLLIHPQPTWHKLSWLAEFVASIAHYETNTIATARLALKARAHLFAWAQAEGIDFDLRTRGILHVYRDAAGFAHGQNVSKLLLRGGVVRHTVGPEEMRAIEPAISGELVGGFYTPDDSTGDIHQYTVGLAAAAQRKGVQLHFDHAVQALTPTSAGIRVRSLCDSAVHDAEFKAVVVCAGVASRALAASLGDRVNVYPVKGYSITVDLPDEASRSAAPVVSLLDDRARVACSRLGEGRLRVAGTAEFNGEDRDIRASRIQPLVGWVRQNFPAVNTRHAIPWAGLRPMMPNLMPRVGPGARPGVFYNTGHGHLGWTLAAATAELVADAVQAAHPHAAGG